MYRRSYMALCGVGATAVAGCARVWEDESDVSEPPDSEPDLGSGDDTADQDELPDGDDDGERPETTPEDDDTDESSADDAEAASEADDTEAIPEDDDAGVTDALAYDESIDGERILLPLNQVPDGFEFLDDIHTSVDEADDDEREALEEAGILKQRSRTYIGVEGTDQEGGYLLSEFEVYDSIDRARHERTSSVETIEDRYGGDAIEPGEAHPIDTVAVGGEDEDHGLYAFVGRNENLVVRLLVVGDVSQSTAEGLYAWMVVGIE